MGRAVKQGHPDVHDRVAGVRPFGHRLHDPRSTAGTNSRGTRPPTTLFVNSNPPRGRGLNPEDDVGVLAVASGLLHELPLVLHGPDDRLPVGDLGLPRGDLDPELPAQAVDDDLEVQLPHSRHDDVPGLGVGPDEERGVLGGEVGEAPAQAVGVRPADGGHREVDHRGGELDRRQHDRLPLVAQGVAGVGLPRPTAAPTSPA